MEAHSVTITVYKNNDAADRGVLVSFNTGDVPNVAKLVEQLGEYYSKNGGSNGIRANVYSALYSRQDGLMIDKIDEIRNNEQYVVSARGYKNIDYGVKAREEPKRITLKDGGFTSHGTRSRDDSDEDKRRGGKKGGRKGKGEKDGRDRDDDENREGGRHTSARHVKVLQVKKRSSKARRRSEGSGWDEDTTDVKLPEFEDNEDDEYEVPKGILSSRESNKKKKSRLSRSSGGRLQWREEERDVREISPRVRKKRRSGSRKRYRSLNK